MSTFSIQFHIDNIDNITSDDISKINNMITSHEFQCVHAFDEDDDYFDITVKTRGGKSECYISGSYPIFEMFGEYELLKVSEFYRNTLIDFGKPKQVKCSPYLLKKHQKYLHENYNVINPMYYPGIIIKPDCMLVYEFKHLDDCKHFIDNVPQDIRKLELLISDTVFNLKNKKILDELMTHISTFSNLEIFSIQNIHSGAIKYNFKPIMFINCDTIIMKHTSTKYVFRNPYVRKIIINCNVKKIIRYMQKNTTLKELKVRESDWSKIPLPEELQYLIDRNNQPMKSARSQ